LNDVEAEAAETQSWLEFAVACNYLSANAGGELQQAYDKIISTLVGMVQHSDSWVMPSGQRGESR
jgi:four helix bundle protein